MIITLNIHIPETAPETNDWYFATKIEAFINGHTAFIYEIPAGRKQWKLFNVMNQQPTQTRVHTSKAALIGLLNRIFVATRTDFEGRYQDGFNPKWLYTPPPELGRSENPHP